MAFLRSLRDVSPQTAVVVLTAFRTTYLEEVALSLGITHLFDKPMPFDDIVALVSALKKDSASPLQETT